VKTGLGFDARRFPAVVTVAFTAISTLAALVATGIHLATYGPEEWGSTLMNFALALFPVVFLIFGPAVIVLSLGRLPLWSLLSSLPRPMIVIGIVVLVYVFVDFFLMFRVLPGQPEQQGTSYFFNEHGLLVPIGLHQYNQALMHSARLFTGHELWFLGFAAVLSYQFDRLRRGQITLDTAPRDEAIENHPLPPPLSRALTLQTMLSPEECAARLLQPARRPMFAFVGRYGMRGEATTAGFRLELAGSNTSLVYAVGRFGAASRPTFIRVLLTFKRWPLISFGLSTLFLPLFWLFTNAAGIPFAWQGLLFVFIFGVGANFAFALAQMRNLLKQIKQATDGEEVAAGDAPLNR